MRYKVKIKVATIYSGYVDMAEEEYEKLCLKDGDRMITELLNKANFPKKWYEEKLEEFGVE